MTENAIVGLFSMPGNLLSISQQVTFIVQIVHPFSLHLLTKRHHKSKQVIFCSKQNVQFLYSYFRGSICAICNYNFNKYYRSVIEAMVGVFVPEKYVTGHAQGPDQNIASENDIVEEGTTSLDRVRAHLYLMNCQRGLYLPSLDDHLYHAIVRTYL